MQYTYICMYIYIYIYNHVISLCHAISTICTYVMSLCHATHTYKSIDKCI